MFTNNLVLHNSQETYGFIKCPSKEGSLIYFKLTEVIDFANPLKLNDEVEFTYNTDPQTRKFQANRISTLPNGTIFNILPRGKSSLNNNNNSSSGSNTSNLENNNFPLIDLSSDDHLHNSSSSKMRGLNGNANNDAAVSVWQQLQIDNANNKVPILESIGSTFGSPSTRNAADAAFGPGDQSSIFNMNGHSENSGSQVQSPSTNGEFYGRAVGFVVAVKESYCFIESIDGENEYFGHQSGYLDEDLEMGQTVDFTAAYLNGKWKATDIRRTRHTVAMYEGELSDIYTGIVLRTIQMFNTEQAEYCGLVARTDQLQTLEIDLAEAASIEERYDFSMTSFKFLKDYIAVGDMVKFQVGTSPGTRKRRAYNIEVLRERIKVSLTFLFF